MDLVEEGVGSAVRSTVDMPRPNFFTYSSYETKKHD